MRNKLLATGVATVLAAAGLSIVETSPAAAAGTFGCEYPRVCLYTKSSDWIARKPTAWYQKITPDWQRLGPRSVHAYAVYNTRMDDSVWLLSDDETVSCVGPLTTWFFDELDVPQRIVALQIVDDPDCFVE
ncbi:hypothetical protein [Actinoplanes solisilvae]|uniref:hypothetical protein n=1 Tax=Actinoplanes solisilvae TaxID=2486853 RepID=UPI000FD73774|nr:hypothetical protein [Actinoplanes solisilvae]